MEDLSQYSLALIAGGFTVVGVLVGVLITYRLAVQLELVRERRAACAAFKAAFAPALAEIYLARHHGDYDPPCVGDALSSSLRNHASAVEIFCPLVPICHQNAFVTAWEKYRATVRQSNHTIDTAEWGTYEPRFADVEKKIYELLSFAS